MHCSRLFADDRGASHFGDVDVPLAEANFAPPAAPFLVGERIHAKDLLFFEFPKGWTGQLHPAPARQYLVVLSGTVEVESSDGDNRRLTPGMAMLVEDISGSGHVTRVVGDAPVEGVFIQLAPPAS